MRTMENEKLRVQISDHGAELCSIYDKEADREAVWIGDPAFWNRHALGTSNGLTTSRSRPSLTM